MAAQEKEGESRDVRQTSLKTPQTGGMEYVSGKHVIHPDKNNPQTSGREMGSQGSRNWTCLQGSWRVE